jgi:hypothetical protein
VIEYFKEHYGDFASVIGLVVSLVGFLVTILGVRKAERSAEDARRAAREVVLKIKSHYLSNEIERSIRLFREVDKACRGRAWDEAVDRSDEARTRLAQFLNDERFADDERTMIRLAVDFLGAFLLHVQRVSLASPPKNISIPKAKQLHEIITGLSQIQGRLQSATLEV